MESERPSQTLLDRLALRSVGIYESSAWKGNEGEWTAAGESK